MSKPKKVKAKPFCRIPGELLDIPYNKDAPDFYTGYVLPTDNDSYDQMLKQVAHALDPDAEEMCGYFERRMNQGDPAPWYDYRIEAKQKAAAALKAIGITRSKRK